MICAALAVVEKIGSALYQMPSSATFYHPCRPKKLFTTHAFLLEIPLVQRLRFAKLWRVDDQCDDLPPSLSSIRFPSQPQGLLVAPLPNLPIFRYLTHLVVEIICSSWAVLPYLLEYNARPILDF